MVIYKDYPIIKDDEFLNKYFDKCISDNGCKLVEHIKKNKDGYIRVGYKHQNLMLHRTVLSMTSGEDHPDLRCSHKCGLYRTDKKDMRNCIEPTHLKWQNNSDDNKDKFEKWNTSITTN